MIQCRNAEFVDVRQLFGATIVTYDLHLPHQSGPKVHSLKRSEFTLQILGQGGATFNRRLPPVDRVHADRRVSCRRSPSTVAQAYPTECRSDQAGSVGSIQKLRDDLRADTYAPRTINSIIRIVGAVFRRLSGAATLLAIRLTVSIAPSWRRLNYGRVRTRPAATTTRSALMRF